MKYNEELESAVRQLHKKTKYSRITLNQEACNYVDIYYRHPFKSFSVYCKDPENLEKLVIKDIEQRIKDMEGNIRRMTRDLYAIKNPDAFLKEEIFKVLGQYPLITHCGYGLSSSFEDRELIISEFQNIRLLKDIIREYFGSIKAFNDEASDASLIDYINMINPSNPNTFSQGEFIVAALLLGFKILPNQDNTVNFNFSKASVRDFKKLFPTDE